MMWARYALTLVAAMTVLCGASLSSRRPVATPTTVPPDTTFGGVTDGAPDRDINYTDADGNLWFRENLLNNWPTMFDYSGGSGAPAAVWWVSPADIPLAKSEYWATIGSTDTSRVAVTTEGVQTFIGAATPTTENARHSFKCSTDDSTEAVIGRFSYINWNNDHEYYMVVKFGVFDWTSYWAIGVWGGNNPLVATGMPRGSWFATNSWDGTNQSTNRGFGITGPNPAPASLTATSFYAMAAASETLSVAVDHVDVSDNLALTGDVVTAAFHVFGYDSAHIFVNDVLDTLDFTAYAATPTDLISPRITLQDAGAALNQMVVTEWWFAVKPRGQ